jgi:hypothetical protein
VYHLSTECDIIKEIKEHIHDVAQVNQPPCAKYRRGEHQLVTEKNENLHWRKMEAVTCFVIRREMQANFQRSKQKQHNIDQRNTIRMPRMEYNIISLRMEAKEKTGIRLRKN